MKRHSLFSGKKKNINLSTAEYAQRVVKAMLVLEGVCSLANSILSLKSQ